MHKWTNAWERSNAGCAWHPHLASTLVNQDNWMKSQEWQVAHSSSLTPCGSLPEPQT